MSLGPLNGEEHRMTLLERGGQCRLRAP